MSAAELLHPALQHHIVNSLGWRELRPFQSVIIPPILSGKHMLVLAPTAGGKTEAAFFPVLSRMLTEDWSGLSVLYVCPIKALLNNLDTRLQRYADLVGRRSAIWHGDVSASDKKRILKEPPDCLLTTPESIEGMLVSSRVDSTKMFAGVRVVIIDELHAFASDDRGWHLLSLLERLSRLTGGDPQRIGISATVGNPGQLLEWLAGHCAGECGEVQIPMGAAQDAEVSLDFVGTLQNAATVISRLHRGEKRLVFVDSRSKAELLGNFLRERAVETFVSHSSLSPEARRASEEAFSTGRNCVIVATSALELGIDVGDLDRVIQIDAPSTVASFLQRMGRSGRRVDSKRNCLFLATSEQSLVQAAALIELWKTGYVEPVIPPQKPYNVLAQQIMALVLQEGGIGRSEWQRWLGRIPEFRAMTNGEVEAIFTHMICSGILSEVDGRLWFGEGGEKLFGKKSFSEVLSVFTSPPLFAVLAGREEIGYVDQLSFAQKSGDELVLSLGGRSWRVTSLDWSRRVAYVEPTSDVGRSLWSGAQRSVGERVSRAIKSFFVDSNCPVEWSRRTQEASRKVREEFSFLDADRTTVVDLSDGVFEWWTFAGAHANLTLHYRLSGVGVESRSDALKLRIYWSNTWGELLNVLRTEANWADRLPSQVHTTDSGKFDACLPEKLKAEMLVARNLDIVGAEALINERPTAHIF